MLFYLSSHDRVSTTSIKVNENLHLFHVFLQRTVEQFTLMILIYLVSEVKLQTCSDTKYVEYSEKVHSNKIYFGKFVG